MNETSVLLKVIGEDKKKVLYRPAFARMTDNVLAAILLQQVLYWWNENGSKPFYKFRNAAPKVAQYRTGDSWCEELEWSTAEFDTAIKTIGTKVTKGIGKKDLLATEFPSQLVSEGIVEYFERVKTAMSRVVIYWRDANNLTWYQVNEELLGKFINSIYLSNSHSLKYLRKQVYTFTHPKAESEDTSIPEITETTSDTKDSSVANNATGSDSILDTDSKENPNPPATKTNTQDPLQSSAKVSPAKPPREQDPIYNAVAEHIFGITDAETLKLMQEKESAATRIGIIVSWLNGKTDSIAYGKTKKFVGKINGTPTPEHVKTFAAWYARKNSTAAMIRDGEKFVEYWRQWASTVKKTSTPRPSAPAQPAAQLTDEQRQRRQAELAARRNGAAHEHA